MSGQLKVESDNGATVMRELNTPFNNGENQCRKSQRSEFYNAIDQVHLIRSTEISIQQWKNTFPLSLTGTFPTIIHGLS